MAEDAEAALAEVAEAVDLAVASEEVTAADLEEVTDRITIIIITDLSLDSDSIDLITDMGEAVLAESSRSS